MAPKPKSKQKHQNKNIGKVTNSKRTLLSDGLEDCGLVF